MEIELVNGGVALVDDEDYPRLAGQRWHRARNKNTDYARNTSCVGMHRIVLGLSDSRLHVDHINGNGLDNRRCNLRAVSVGDNLRGHRKAKGPSGVAGVWQIRPGKWEAVMTRNYQRRHLGVFNTIEEAVAARNAAHEEWERTGTIAPKNSVGRPRVRFA